MPPVHAQPVAAGLQLAVSVIGLPTVPVVGPVTLQTGGADTTQDRVCGPGGALSVKELQLLSVRVMVACANAPAEVRASVAEAHANAAQRKNDRFIDDSLRNAAKAATNGACKFRASCFQ